MPVKVGDSWSLLSVDGRAFPPARKTIGLREPLAVEGTSRCTQSEPYRFAGRSCRVQAVDPGRVRACSESVKGENGAILRREGAVLQLDHQLAPPGPARPPCAAPRAAGANRRCRGAQARAENERLRTKLAQAEAIIDVDKCTSAWRSPRRARSPTTNERDRARRPRR